MKIIDKIEQELAKGNLSAVRDLIGKLSLTARRTPAVRHRLAQVFLRLPQPVKAFRLLEDTPHATPEITLTLANAANFLGASGYALRLLDSVDDQVKRSRPVDVGQILSTNWQDEEALDWFVNAGSAEDPTPANTPTGQQQLLLRCYPLIELQRYEEASAISEWFLKTATSEMTKGFAYLFGAWANIELGEKAKAQMLLNKCRDFAKSSPGSWPAALYLLVAGINAIKEEKWDVAIEFQQLAFSALYKKGMQPEASWFSVVYWLGFAKYKKTDQISEEWARLILYPAITSAFLNKIPEHCIENIPFLLTAAGTKQEPSYIHLLPTENTWIIGKGHKQLMNGPIQLLAMLVAAGPYGVPMFRLFDNLWPTEPMSVKSHGKKLEQYVDRLRKMGLAIEWSDNHLFAATGNRVTVECLPRQKISLPRELLNRTFSKSDVAKLFRISSRSATRLCTEWLNSGKIKKLGAGPATQYTGICSGKIK